jgi:predicted Rossmann fold nucleotide-binding protein DprA/Smf involved in DNA uptake
MPKTFPIRLEVEEIALGTVLRKLNEMPGIAKLDLDLGKGGEGPGRKNLEAAAPAPRGNNAQAIIKMLVTGPKSINEMLDKLGGKKSSFYTATSKLKAQGLATSVDGKWTLTEPARAKIDELTGKSGEAAPALPAPSNKKAKKDSKGRAGKGSGPIFLRTILSEGPKSPSQVREHAVEHGLSSKSITGVLDRAKKAGLIKKNGEGYTLTLKGQQIEMPANG